LRTRPKEPKSSVLSIEEEAIIVSFRKHTLLPLDDCLYALRPTIPHLTRSSLHRCLVTRHFETARDHGQQARQAQVQDLSDRLLPHRHCRGPSCGRQAIPVCRD
jgi:hypothetical protein